MGATRVAETLPRAGHEEDGAGGAVRHQPTDPASALGGKGFEEWGEVLGDEVMAAALIDRLLHHCHIVNIRGNSYRMRHHTELSKTLHSAPAEPSPSLHRPRRNKKKEKTTT